MATRQWHGVLRSLRHAVWLVEGREPTDAELLEAYRARREEAPFEALVRRHGPMVRGVCRRILRHAQDAEDAFQATFLVLVRKACSIKPARLVGNWLHGVAYRTAMNARAEFSRRKKQEQESSRPEAAEPIRDRAVELLDQEIDRLPDKYRAPLVLCDLEGKTRTEAARHLGWPEGTVAGRLSRARALLARRLRRRGLAVGGGALALEFARLTATAAMPGKLVVATLKASTLFAIGKTAAGGIPANVFALTNGVLKTMLLNRLKLACVVVAFVLAGLASMTAGVISQPARAAGEQESAPPLLQEAERSGTTKVPRAKHPHLQGIWALTHAECDGKRLTVERDSVHLVVTNRFWIWEERGKDRAFTYGLGAKTEPKEIDLTCFDEGAGKRETTLGIYAIEGDELTVCESDGARPSRLSAKPGSGCTLFVYRRVATAAPSATAPAPRADGLAASEKSEDIDAIVTERSIKIPVLVPPDARGKIKEIRLLTSADRGKVWRVTAVLSPDERDFFNYEAPKNGLYWFAVQMVHRDGTLSPKDPKSQPPALKMLVNSKETPPPDLAPESPAPWANKLFGVLHHDFGNLPSGTQRVHRFPLKNVYNVPLDITNVCSSCSCVTVTPSVNRLKPNEVGFIDVVMDARRFRGAKTVSIYVTFGNDYVSTATLHVSANAVGEAKN